MSLEAFAVSTGVVALGEMGDKTQLLALLLAARFRAPRPIILGILVATLLNHALAAALGAWLTQLLEPQWLRWGLGASFIAVALWMLIPDQASDASASTERSRFGVFGITVVAFFLAEMGDKTQLLALLLAARFRAPRPIILGILVATLLNHALAAALGAWLTQLLEPQWLRWGLGASFIAVALWMLVPDQATAAAQGTERSRFGVFGITAFAFFLAEMGDKTQIATVMLAARYNALIVVTAGTTLGMMIANVPAVLLGDQAVKFVPIAWVHRIAAAVFAAIGVAVLAGVGS
jgi:Ca2+/H+ antiporter, TMEM165/GDT1 family